MPRPTGGAGTPLALYCKVKLKAKVTMVLKSSHTNDLQKQMVTLAFYYAHGMSILASDPFVNRSL